MRPLQIMSVSSVKSLLPPPRLPSHRHGTPSAPWPFVDTDDDMDQQSQVLPQSTRTADSNDQLWSGYPQSLYPNWSPFQQRKSGISTVLEQTSSSTKSTTCNVYKLDVWDGATFHRASEHAIGNDPNDTTGQHGAGMNYGQLSQKMYR